MQSQLPANRLSGFMKASLSPSARDTLKTAVALLSAASICQLLKPVAQGDSHVPLIFVLAVLIVSMSTTGYLYGLVATVVSVIGVNYAFTYPYYNINFTMTGYPVTFLCMSAVSVITCTLASRARSSELARLKNERERMRSDLLRTLSHDLRTPLTTISGSANLILDNEKNLSREEILVMLADIRDEAEWLNTALDNILSVTRFQTDAGEYLQTRPEIVEEVLEEAVHRFRRQSVAEKVTVSVRSSEEVLIVPMNAILIEQALINLMVNAAQHGKITTQISVFAEKAEDGVLFHVQDNGQGFDEKLLPHLFEGDEVLLQMKTGNDSNRFMGIGLSACRSIVKAHGGMISAENLPQGGAEVYFLLPDTAVMQPESQM